MSSVRSQVVAAAGPGPAAQAVAGYAAREAAGRGDVLRLVHVLPAGLPLSRRTFRRAGSLQSAGAAILDRAATVAAAAAPDVPVALTLLSGARAESLLASAEDAALVVVGSSGASGASGLWPGSLVTTVAMGASCPVAVVPHGGDSPVSRVVVGLRWPPHADQELLEEAFSAAQRVGCDLQVVHAATRHEPEWVATLTGLIEERLVELRRAHPPVRVHVDVVASSAHEALARAATPGTLVVIARARGWARGRLLGPTTRELLHRAQGPVEIVPPSSTEGLVRPWRRTVGSAAR